MAWTAPMTAVFNNVLTAAQWNTYVRDNFNETMPGKATTAGRHFVSTDKNAIAERAITSAEVTTAQTTTSTSYANLTTTGPAVTVTTGTKAALFYGCRLENSTAGAQTWFSVAVSGATTTAANDEWGGLMDGITAANQWDFSMFKMFDNLTAGSNTFTMQYRVTTGTGTFANRQIAVIAF